MGYEKYHKALAIMDLLIESDGNIKRCIGADCPIDYRNEAVTELRKRLFKPVHNQWDRLYRHVFATFKNTASDHTEWSHLTDKNIEVTPEIQAELESMREMFKLNREEMEERLYEIPNKVLEQCFPVWMARYLLAHRDCDLWPTRLQTFDRFHKMYGFIICNA